MGAGVRGLQVAIRLVLRVPGAILVEGVGLRRGVPGARGRFPSSIRRCSRRRRPPGPPLRRPGGDGRRSIPARIAGSSRGPCAGARRRAPRRARCACARRDSPRRRPGTGSGTRARARGRPPPRAPNAPRPAGRAGCRSARCARTPRPRRLPSAPPPLPDPCRRRRGAAGRGVSTAPRRRAAGIRRPLPGKTDRPRTAPAGRPAAAAAARRPRRPARGPARGTAARRAGIRPCNAHPRATTVRLRRNATQHRGGGAKSRNHRNAHSGIDRPSIASPPSSSRRSREDLGQRLGEREGVHQEFEVGAAGRRGRGEVLHLAVAQATPPPATAKSATRAPVDLEPDAPRGPWSAPTRATIPSAMNA